MSTKMFGARVQRTNDPKLLRGEGAFVDDIALEGALHVAFVRSPFARATIRSIDVPAARRLHGVAAVYNWCGAFARAEHFTRIRVRVERSTAAPMECRAVAARWDDVNGELTVWDGTQAPLSVRGGLASLFKLDEDKVRVIAPNVGGGFGQKVLL